MTTETLWQRESSVDESPHAPVIDARGLVKSYGDRAVLKGLTFSVQPQEIFGILGPNGAGKTIAVEAIQGLRGLDGGRIRVLGRDPYSQRRELRSLIGSQLQSSSLPDRLRVGEALRLFSRIAGDVVDWRAVQATWGLEALERTAFGGLSGGERQRLFIALSLVNEPEVVFLDELTQGLDPVARRETWGVIRRIREQGSTVVLVSHFMDEVEQLCDRVGVLHDGRITACDTPSGLIASANGQVRTRFTLDAGRLPGRLDQVPGVTAVASGGGIVEVTGDPSSPVLVAAELAREGVLPEDFTVVRPSLEDVFITLTSGGRS